MKTSNKISKLLDNFETGEKFFKSVEEIDFDLEDIDNKEWFVSFAVGEYCAKNGANKKYIALSLRPNASAVTFCFIVGYSHT